MNATNYLFLSVAGPGLFLKASSSRSSVGGEVKGHKVEQKFTELVFECVKFLCVQPAA